MNKLFISILSITLLVSGCASLRETAESTDTFAICKTLDIGTTAVALHTGHFVEKNPLVAPLISHGYLPLIAVSVVLWYLIDYYNEPLLTIGANAITCPVAIHNAVLLM